MNYIIDTLYSYLSTHMTKISNYSKLMDKNPELKNQFQIANNITTTKNNGGFE